MIINKHLLDGLTDEARKSSRLRMNRDMRNSTYDQSQRMLNAIEPGTEVPIHRHPKTSETCIIVRGRAEQLLFDDMGNVTCRLILEPGSNCVGLNINADQWHKIVALESGTVIFEAKDGAYEPVSPKDILTL
jgi:hypothetical protein